MKGKIWMDGRLVNFEDAKVHVLAHGFHYGTGVFEGIRVYHTERGRNIFRLRDHMVRFLNSAKVLQMKVPYSLDELCEACREVVRRWLDGGRPGRIVNITSHAVKAPIPILGLSNSARLGLTDGGARGAA
mgnify:CR=1 FL=1